MSRAASLFGTVWHRYLGVPYTLHVYRQSRVSKAAATLVFLHGIGNSGKTWDDVVAGVPDTVDVVILDMLGFGDSPRPEWAIYDAATQARSVAKTLLASGVFKNVVLVGHSMGSLVAVEFARRYPRLVSSLVLCSPPIYSLDKSDDATLFSAREVQLRRLYELAISQPERLVKLTQLARRLKLLSASFAIDAASVSTYIAALRANIITQTTRHDIIRLRQPIDILYGTLDPFVIGETLETLAAGSDGITLTKCIAGHEVMGRYTKKVQERIVHQLETRTV